MANPVLTRRLLDGLGPAGLDAADAASWAESTGHDAERAARWRERARAFDLDGELRRLEALGGRALILGESGYPRSLAELPDAPLALYCLGTWTDAPAAAVVGSRAPTEYGRRTARRLAAELVERGVVVVSGLARGIDAEAHEAALDAGGRTWAVLGSGFGAVYPPDNRDLFRRVADEGGCALSEYPFSVAPARETFPRRNRIVAGLAEVTVVVEGRFKSGSLITAQCAVEYGRPVLAVPGPADSPLSEAPHKLLREGAALATGGADVAALLGAGRAVEPRRSRKRVPAPELDRDAARVLKILGGDSHSLEELCQATGLDMPRLSLIMFDLEIKNFVSAVPGQRYAKKSH